MMTPLAAGEVRRLELSCPAKINLGLHVLGKRPDGYHELDSLVLKLESLADTLSLQLRAAPRTSIRLQITQQGGAQGDGVETLPTDARNLVYRAAQRYLTHYPQPVALQMHLHKRIPIAAGLGGGSSDAASTLKGLASLLPLGLDVQALALELGSDVPLFLLESQAARMQGRGERLTPLTLPLEGWRIHLANPGIAVSAAEAYGLLTGFDAPLPLDAIVDALQNNEPPPLHNSLQRGVLTKYPKIAALMDALEKAGGKALMSGSGSSCLLVTRASSASEWLSGSEYWTWQSDAMT